MINISTRRSLLNRTRSQQPAALMHAERAEVATMPTWTSASSLSFRSTYESKNKTQQIPVGIY